MKTERATTIVLKTFVFYALIVINKLIRGEIKRENEMVPMRGLEPPWDCSRQLLRLLCLRFTTPALEAYHGLEPCWSAYETNFLNPRESLGCGTVSCTTGPLVYETSELTAAPYRKPYLGDLFDFVKRFLIHIKFRNSRHSTLRL